MKLNHYLLLCFCFISFQLFSQDAKLSGTVTQENGEAVISANVVIDASKGQGTVTDFDGKYELSIAPGSYEVTIRYIGKEEQKHKITLDAGEKRH